MSASSVSCLRAPKVPNSFALGHRRCPLVENSSHGVQQFTALFFSGVGGGGGGGGGGCKKIGIFLSFNFAQNLI